jgi:hypothetical protein
VRAARAKRIVLVNSDLLVAKGWLYSLWSTMEDNKRAGLVGPMMLGDGHLITEAGGVVWKDASAANFGRGATHSEHAVGGPGCLRPRLPRPQLAQCAAPLRAPPCPAQGALPPHLSTSPLPPPHAAQLRPRRRLHQRRVCHARPRAVPGHGRL